MLVYQASYFVILITNKLWLLRQFSCGSLLVLSTQGHICTHSKSAGFKLQLRWTELQLNSGYMDNITIPGFVII
jgi:hypothetical protein